MKSRKLSLVAMLALVGCLTACGGGYSTYTAPEDARYVGGLKVRDTYRTSLAAAIQTLNYLTTATQSNWVHIFNFVDPLCTTNEYGIEILDLATKAEHNEDYTEFTFTIQEDVPWITSAGEQYVARNGEAQYVSAEDWVTTCLEELTYGNGSSTYYFATMFLQGASEYYAYTYIQYLIALGTSTGGADNARYQPDTDTLRLGGSQYFEGITASTSVMIDAINWAVLNLVAGVEGTVDEGNFESVVDGSIVGVSATTDPNTHGGGTLTYSLLEPADYFPSLLTYALGLPTNAAFLESIGGCDNFGVDKDSILYCGPYLCTESDTNTVVYEANPFYVGVDKDKVHLDKVVYNVIPSTTDDDYYRRQFEKNNIDSATIRSTDTEGWNKYIVGKKGKGDGTIEDPYDPSVYSYYRESIGTLIDACVVPNRIDTDTLDSYVSYTTEEDVINTSQALSLVEVRQAILDSLDIDTFMMSRSEIPELREQYAKHAYTPSGLGSADGKDYSEFYNEEVRAHLLASGDITEATTQAEVDAQLANGTWGDTSFANEKIALNHTAEYVAKSAEAAKDAIDAYNAELKKEDGIISTEDVLNPSWGEAGVEGNEEEESTADTRIFRSEITLPIKVEYASGYYDETTQAYDAAVILEMNELLNGLTEEQAKDVDLTNPGATSGVWCWIYQMDQGVNDNTDWYNNVCFTGCFDTGVIWGWGADYADPKTYLNTYAVAGDWADIYPWLLDDAESFKLGEDGSLTWQFSASDVSDDVAAKWPEGDDHGVASEYTALYNYANTFTQDKTSRFEYYAQAEYLLVNEQAVMKPVYNDGNGWSITLNRTVSYEMPQANFGATDERLVGLWVLDKIPTNAQRHDWLDEFYALRDEAKAACPTGMDFGSNY